MFNQHVFSAVPLFEPTTHCTALLHLQVALGRMSAEEAKDELFEILGRPDDSEPLTYELFEGYLGEMSEMFRDEANFKHFIVHAWQGAGVKSAATVPVRVYFHNGTNEVIDVPDRNIRPDDEAAVKMLLRKQNVANVHRVEILERRRD